MTPAELALDALTFAYPGGPPVVRGVTLAVPAGAWLTLLGPSGCGKSTLLRLVGGYLAPDAGSVRLGGRDLTRLPPEARNIGTVFQSYALFPHLSARDNVAFGLRMRGVGRRERHRVADDWLARVGLTPAEGDRLPAALSGGQQQRVAVARALAIAPPLLLLDEPLAHLDRQVRATLARELRRVQREAGVTTVMVTHDADEALSLSDAVAVMLAGEVRQHGTPLEVYERPAGAEVGRLLGPIADVDGQFVRPERLELVAAGEGVAAVTLPAAYTGDGHTLLVRTDAGDEWAVRLAPGEAVPAPGTRVGVRVRPARGPS